MPETLIGRAERRRIARAAMALPPIPRLALEFRLGAGDQAIDLHQRLRADAPDAASLARYLARASGGPLADAALRRFLSDWSANTDGVRDALDSLYLEWDCPAPGPASAMPGLFLPLDRPGAPASRRRTLFRCLARLAPELAEAAGAALARLAPHLRNGASLNYLGFMLGRAGALRVNVRGIARGDLARFLSSIGWPGDAATAVRQFEALVDISDRVIVALDFAPSLQPSIGFEAVLDPAPERDPRWAELLDHLAAQGLCAEDKRRALEGIHADFLPEAEHPWPAAWLVAALLAPKRCVPWVERLISHLKLTIGADGRAAAKAYVSAEHHWSRGEAAPAVRPAARRRSRGDPNEAASGDAIGFLAAAQGQDGLWRDFSMPGPSDEWVTAFVGLALAGLRDPRARGAARRAAAALLRRQRADGGWGYNRHCPADSDSTAWALKFLDAAGAAEAARRNARAFLLSHLLPGGGIATYAAGATVRYENREWEGPSQGWRSPHLCVAANAAGALPGRLTRVLLAGQADDGSWPAYWWRTDAFATALAAAALAGDDSGREACARAVAWARRQAPLAGSAFDRAWLACLLALGGEADRRTARGLLAALAGEQQADGSWAAGAELLLPHPSQLRRDHGLAPYPDVRRVFTTASVVVAIRALSEGQAT